MIHGYPNLMQIQTSTSLYPRLESYVYAFDQSRTEFNFQGSSEQTVTSDGSQFHCRKTIEAGLVE